jgi:hypothetical protein
MEHDKLVHELRTRAETHFHAFEKEGNDTSRSDSALLHKAANALNESKAAVDLLMQWIEGADHSHPAYAETLAFLGKPNSIGWVMATEVREERDFDAELNRHRNLILGATANLEELLLHLRERFPNV